MRLTQMWRTFFDKGPERRFEPIMHELYTRRRRMWLGRENLSASLNPQMLLFEESPFGEVKAWVEYEIEGVR